MSMQQNNNMNKKHNTDANKNISNTVTTLTPA